MARGGSSQSDFVYYNKYRSFKGRFARFNIIKNAIDFHFVMVCFDLIQIFREIASLSFQVSWGDQFLTEVKKILDSGIFRLGLSNFQIGVWFPFDAFQFNLELPRATQSYIERAMARVQHTSVVNEYLSAHKSCTTNYFQIYSYRSVQPTHSPFSIFCVQIGQLFEAQ